MNMFLIHFVLLMLALKPVISKRKELPRLDLESVPEWVIRADQQTYEDELLRREEEVRRTLMETQPRIEQQDLVAKIGSSIKNLFHKVKGIFTDKIATITIRPPKHTPIKHNTTVATQKPIQKGWRFSFRGFIPEGAVVAGYDRGRRVFVARCLRKEGNFPGMLIEGENGIRYLFIGQLRYTARTAEVLVGHSFIWHTYYGGDHHPDLFHGGWVPPTHQGICRKSVQDHLQVGRMPKNNTKCYIADFHQSYKTYDYSPPFDVLIEDVD